MPRRLMIPTVLALMLVALLPSVISARNSGDYVWATLPQPSGSEYQVYFTVMHGSGKAVIGVDLMYYDTGSQLSGNPLGWTSTMQVYPAPDPEYHVVWAASSKLFAINSGGSLSSFGLIISAPGIQMRWCTITNFSPLSYGTCGMLIT